MADNAVAITLTGFKELDYALRDLGPKVANKIASRAMKLAAEVIAARARANVVVSDYDEPHIRDNINTLVTPSDGSADRLALIGFSASVNWRAGWVEFGTVKMAARPFVRPAIDDEAETAIAVMGDQLGIDIEEAARGYPLGKL